jgi:hypothetical protein
VSPHTGSARLITGRRAKDAAKGRSLKAWIVRSIMIATTGFAFLDLLLLAAGGHR